MSVNNKTVSEVTRQKTPVAKICLELQKEEGNVLFAAVFGREGCGSGGGWLKPSNSDRRHAHQTQSLDTKILHVQCCTWATKEAKQKQTTNQVTHGTRSSQTSRGKRTKLPPSPVTTETNSTRRFSGDNCYKMLTKMLQFYFTEQSIAMSLHVYTQYL